MPKVCRKCFNNKSSLVPSVRAWYSTSASDWATVRFFLVFHDMGEDPNMVKLPVKELNAIRITIAIKSKVSCRYQQDPTTRRGLQILEYTHSDILMILSWIMHDVKPNRLVWCFYNRFGFGSTWFVFNRSCFIKLALSVSLCVVVALGIGHICRWVLCDRPQLQSCGLVVLGVLANLGPCVVLKLCRMYTWHPSSPSHVPIVFPG